GGGRERAGSAAGRLDGQGVRLRRLSPHGRRRHPAARWHRLHLGARPPPLLQAREVLGVHVRGRELSPRAGGPADQSLVSGGGPRQFIFGWGGGRRDRPPPPPPPAGAGARGGLAGVCVRPHRGGPLFFSHPNLRGAFPPPAPPPPPAWVFIVGAPAPAAPEPI